MEWLLKEPRGAFTWFTRSSLKGESSKQHEGSRMEETAPLLVGCLQDLRTQRDISYGIVYHQSIWRRLYINQTSPY